MTKGCFTCVHPHLAKINEELLKGTPATIIAQKYNLSYDSINRHKRSHLTAQIKRIRDREERKTASKIKTTLEYYDELIEKATNDPAILEQMTLKDFLRVLEERSKLLDEQKQPTRIEIVWGAGLEDSDEKKEQAFTIKIPAFMQQAKKKKAEAKAQSEQT